MTECREVFSRGSITKAGLVVLAASARKGIVCVRSTRVATGRVRRNVDVDGDALALVASDDLNPWKARVLLRLALLKPRSPGGIQRLLQEYGHRPVGAGK
jgi:L-asparaginase